MKRSTVVVVAAVLGCLASSVEASDAVVLKGTLCLARSGVVLSVDRTCSPVEGLTPPVEAAHIERRFLWVREDQRACVVGTVMKDATAVNLDPTRFGNIKLALSGDKARGWPEDVRLHLAVGTDDTTEVVLPKGLAQSPFTISVLPGSYRLAITARHHLRTIRDHLSVKPGAAISIGALRLLSAPRLSATVVNAKEEALASAMLMNSDGHVLAAADVNGTLAVELPADLPEYVEVLADGYAPHRVAIDPEARDLALGRLVMRRGASLSVTLDRTSIGSVPVRVAVLTRALGERYHEIVGHDLKATELATRFPPIEAGDYHVSVEGPSPLARHTEAVHLPENGAVDHTISIDPIEIDGEIMIGERRATGGQLSIQPEDGGWEAGVEVRDDGTFHSESWEKGRFAGFYIRDPSRDGTFIREQLEAKSNPTHWHIVIADRSLSGRIFDKDTREPIPDAGLDKETKSDDGGSSMGIVPVRSDGSFVLDAIEPGDYTLNATAEHYMPTTVRVHISAADTVRTVDLPLERGITVLVSIVTPAGEPIARATIIDGVGDGINPDHLYTSDGAGQLTLRLRPNDTRTLYILPREGSFAIADVAASNAADGVRVIVPPPVGAINIRATDNGKPVRGVLPLFRWNGRLLPPPVPRFFPFADRYSAGIWTDENGGADFSSMPAGVYEFFPVRSEADQRALVGGVSTLAPVRVGFTGGSTTVALEVSGPHP